MGFSNLGLCTPILKALKEQDYTSPSPIQAKAIPAILQKQDVMAAAQTGTGKTAGFTLPILQMLSEGEKARPHNVRALVLTPTRELAAQVAESVTTYGKHMELRTAVVFGGVNINPQIKALRGGVDILVATPGRLLDLYQQKAMQFQQLEILVLDEADRMLDMGFIHDIRKIMGILPKKRQSLMFSATFSGEIRALAKTLMHQPVEISVSPPNTTVKLVDQWVCPVDKKNKHALLSHLIWENRWEQILVFTKTKHGANRLAEFLQNDSIPTMAIHGNKSQGARTKALAQFKAGSIRVLVATDIAARGLDIELLPHVINFDLPHVPEDYVHRIGRTGRAGATGEAVSLVSADEAKQLAAIERLINQKLPRKVIDSFEPKHVVPETQKEQRPNNRRPHQSKEGDKKKFSPRPGSRPHSKSRTESEPRTRSESRSRFDAKPGAEGRTRSESRSRFDAKPGAEGRTRSESRSRFDAKPNAESRTKSVSKPHSNSRPGSNTKFRPRTEKK
jgi:ATP-dependent RNA helicase RhlE